ncbi:twin-arginine translocation signal domain-containing protein [Providencia hangzhouensis]
MAINRRQFLKSSAVLLAAFYSLPSFGAN